MRLLCNSASGEVLARFVDNTSSMNPLLHTIEQNIVPSNEQTIIIVPETVTVPEAVIRVVFSEAAEPQYIIDTSAIDQLWSEIKKRRSNLLKECDWICSVSDYSPPNKEEWIIYRQALRDITKQTNPYRLVWPTPPSVI